MQLPTFSRRFVLALLFAAVCLGCGSSSTTTTPRSITYAALGASDAVGIGAVPLSSGYVFLLADLMQGTGAEVDFHNEGISGAHVDDLVREELPAALAADPDIVTIWTGANDLVGGDDPDTFADQLAFLLAELTSKTQAQVFVGDLPDLTQAPVFRDSPDPDVTPARVTAYNERIAAAVAAAGCVLVRLSDVEMTDDMFFVDGFHPNNLGYERLAAAYWDEIAPRL